MGSARCFCVWFGWGVLKHWERGLEGVGLLDMDGNGSERIRIGGLDTVPNLL